MNIDRGDIRGNGPHVRRGVLANIAGGIASSFASRNNDYDGYWALGQLRSLAEQRSVSELRIPFVPRTATRSPLLDGVAARYAGMLARLLERAGSRAEAVVEAHIVVQFAVPENAALLHVRRTWGKPFACEVELRTAWGSTARATATGWCAAHDPANESSRAR